MPTSSFSASESTSPLSSGADAATDVDDVFSTPLGAPKRAELLGRLAAFVPALANVTKQQREGKHLPESLMAAAAAPSCVLATPTPARYELPWSAAASTVDALASGLFFRWLGYARFQGRVVAASGSEFRSPDLTDSAGGSLSTVRQLKFSWLILRVRLLLAGVLLMLLLAYPLLFVPQARASGAYELIRWFIDLFYDVTSGTQQSQPIFSAILVVLITWLFSLMAMMFHLIEKQHMAAMLGAEPSDLPLVLRLLLEPRAPTVMVSYTWTAEAGLHTARSLALTLPDAWIDVRRLTSGMHVASFTEQIAARAEAVIFVLSGEFLRSEACMRELAAAIAFRQRNRHVTLVLHATNDGSSPGGGEGAAASNPIVRATSSATDAIQADHVAEELERHGFLIFREPNDLLRFLSNHVYRATSPEDFRRTMIFFGGSAIPISRLNRAVRLPSPATLGQSISANLCATELLPEQGYVRSGLKYIDVGASKIGTASVLSFELLLAFVLIMLFLAEVVLGAFAPWNGSIAGIAGLVIFMAISSIALFRITASLYVDLDPRNFHDPILLPLNVAAFTNVATLHAGLGATTTPSATVDVSPQSTSRSMTGNSSPNAALHRESSLRLTKLLSSTISAEQPGFFVRILLRGDSDTGPSGNRLIHTSTNGATSAAQLRLIGHFLKNVVGVECVQEDMRLGVVDYGSLLGSSNSRVINVFLIETAEDASSYLQYLTRSESEPQQSIIITHKELLGCRAPEPFEFATLGAFVCVLVGNKHGVIESSPYLGIASAVLDNIGCKVAAALCRT